MRNLCVRLCVAIGLAAALVTGLRAEPACAVAGEAVYCIEQTHSCWDHVWEGLPFLAAYEWAHGQCSW